MATPEQVKLTTPCLTTLPLEVLLLIDEELPVIDAYHLRLSSRQLQHQLPLLRYETLQRAIYRLRQRDSRLPSYHSWNICGKCREVKATVRVSREYQYRHLFSDNISKAATSRDYNETFIRTHLRMNCRVLSQWSTISFDCGRSLWPSGLWITRKAMKCSSKTGTSSGPQWLMYCIQCKKFNMPAATTDGNVDEKEHYCEHCWVAQPSNSDATGEMADSGMRAKGEKSPLTIGEIIRQGLGEVIRRK